MKYSTLNKVYSSIKGNPAIFKSAVFMMSKTGLRYLNVRIDTTNFCNLKCKMCFFSKEKNIKRESMKIDLFNKIASKMFTKTRMLYLSCGAEPLVNSHFIEIINASNGYNIPFKSFATNGMLMNEKIVNNCIERGINEVIFSIDGNTPETQETIRVGSDYKRVLSNLESMDKVINEKNVVLPKIRINFTLMKKNFPELQDFIEHFSSYPSVYIIDIRHMRVHEGMNMDDEVLDKSYQQTYTSILTKMENICKSRNVILQYPKLCHVPENRINADFFCPIPYFSIYVNSSGEVRYCPYVDEAIHIDDFVLPSIKEVSAYLKKNKPNCSICETID
jgi:MoaA/NifB/PqqE/SkfB family radical SAM enzyme